MRHAIKLKCWGGRWSFSVRGNMFIVEKGVCRLTWTDCRDSCLGTGRPR
jgi:hypothetical protein